MQKLNPLLIPAIDLKEGKCVRLKQGNINKSTDYSSNPVEMALNWQNKGAERIHIIDLDGAFAGKPKNLNIIKKICAKLDIKIQVGGGIRSKKIVKSYLNAGVNQVIVGTKAINEPDWLKKLIQTYPNQVILGLDAYGDKLATRGWQKTTNLDLFSFAKNYDNSKLFAIIYTDISRDGMLGGINWKKTSQLANAIKTKVIASGGLANTDDIVQLKEKYQQTEGNLWAAIAGKSLYEKTLDYQQAQVFLNSNHELNAH